MLAKFFLAISLVLTLYSCTRNTGGYEFTDWVNVKGRYIGKESCYSEENKHYHLIVLDERKIYGDTIELDGSQYYNVVKATGILDSFQINGKLLDFDAKISKENYPSNGCTINPTVTFSLPVMTIINQAEFR